MSGVLEGGFGVTITLFCSFLFIFVATVVVHGVCRDIGGGSLRTFIEGKRGIRREVDRCGYL